jgi:hypothetical protein
VGRKDRERFQRLQEGNPDYVGYRGSDTVIGQAPSQETETVTVVRSVCNRKRNVASAASPKTSAPSCVSVVRRAPPESHRAS